MPSLLEYRQEFARRVGGLLVLTPTNASTTTSLVNLTDPNIYSEIDQDTNYEDAFIFRPAAVTASKLRFVKSHESLQGKLHPSAPWSVAPATSEAVEIHKIFDPLNEVPSLINTALKRCTFPVTVSFTPDDPTLVRYDLTAEFAWLDDDRYVFQAGTLQATDDFDKVVPTPINGAVEMDSGHVILKAGPFSSTQVIYLKVIQPWYYNCVAAATPLVPQSGLILDTDTCGADLNWVTAGAIVQAWQDYDDRLGPLAEKNMQLKLATQAEKFTLETALNCRWPERTLQITKRIGPIGYGGIR